MPTRTVGIAQDSTQQEEAGIAGLEILASEASYESDPLPSSIRISGSASLGSPSSLRLSGFPSSLLGSSLRLWSRIGELTPSSIRLQGLIDLQKASQLRISGQESSKNTSYIKIVITRTGIQSSYVRVWSYIGSLIGGSVRFFPPFGTFGRIRFGEIQSGGKPLNFNRTLTPSSIRIKGSLGSVLPSKINLFGDIYSISSIRLCGEGTSSVPAGLRIRALESQTKLSEIRLKGSVDSTKPSDLRISGSAAVNIPSYVHILAVQSLRLSSSMRLKGEVALTLPGEIRIQGTESQDRPSQIHIVIYPQLRIYSKIRIRGSKETSVTSWIRIWDRPGHSYYLTARGSSLRVRAKIPTALPSSLRISSDFKAYLPSRIRMTAQGSSILPAVVILSQGVVKPSSVRIRGPLHSRISSRVSIKVLKHGDFGLRKFGELPFGSQIHRSNSLKSSKIRIRGWKDFLRSSRIRLATGRSSLIASSINLAGYALKSLPSTVRLSGKAFSLKPSSMRMCTGRNLLLPSHLYIYGYEPVSVVDQEPIVTVSFKIVD